MTRLVFSLVGDVRRNSRALKFFTEFAALGFTVEALSLGPPPAAPDDLPENVRLHVLPRPTGSGVRFFRAIHQQFKAKARTLPADLYHASDLYTLGAMHAAAQQHSAKLTFDARELYPHVAGTIGRPWISWFWDQFQRRYIRDADAVFTVSPRIAHWLAHRYGIPEPPVLYNAPPLQNISKTNILREKLNLSDHTVIFLHQGNMQPHRGCERLMEAMAEVDGAALVFLGEGVLKPHLQAYVATHDLNHCVYFLPPVPPAELLPLTASADVGITLLDDRCLNHQFALPNKLFEYIMAGIPILASNLPAIRNIVATFELGKVVNAADKAELVQALRMLQASPTARARWCANTRRASETFQWATASNTLRATYKTLIAP